MNTTTENEDHYAWGASNAKTWRGCLGAVNFAERERALGNIPEDTETEWAKEGTVAHKYADDFLTGKIGMEEIPPNFWEHLKGYIDFAAELASTVGGGDCIVANEQKVRYWYNTLRTGTLDFGVVAEDASEIAILDLKYGAGEYVTADENSQGAIYAISWIKELEGEGYVFKDDAIISIYIYQPRHWKFDNAPELWRLSYRDLMDYAIDIEDDYLKSKQADPEDLTPSEDACRFCDAKVVCTKRVVDMFDKVPDESNMLIPANQGKPKLPAISKLTDEARLAIFKHRNNITKWMDDVVEDTLIRIEQGASMEGLKTVDGREGNRSWGDRELEAEKLLRKIPASKRYLPRRIISPTQAQKVLKEEGIPLTKQSTKFKNRWEAIVYRRPSRPTLALESDARPARITGPHRFDVIQNEVSTDDCF